MENKNNTTKELSNSNITLINKVLPNGAVGYAVVCDFGTNVDCLKLSKSSFHIELMFEGTSCARTITKVYTNDTIAISDKVKIGRYVVIEMDSKDKNISTIGPSNIPSQIVKYDKKYYLTQKEDITTDDGTVYKASDNKLSPDKVVTPVVDDFKKLTYVTSSCTKLNYRFFEPKTESDKKYPLVLFLHGTGERGSDNETQLLCYEGALVWAKPEQQSKNPCYVIAPQAPMADKVTSFWTDEPVYNMVINLVKDAIDKYPIDTNRIYITGLSNGGTGTWYIAGTNTDLFAAAVPICGRSNRSFGNRTCLPEIGTVCLYVPADSEILSAVKDMPIWVFHAADDPICDVRNSRDAVETIKLLGGTSINYTEFNAGTVKPYGHAAWAPAYENNDMINWLFEQSK